MLVGAGKPALDKRSQYSIGLLPTGTLLSPALYFAVTGKKVELLLWGLAPFLGRGFRKKKRGLDVLILKFQIRGILNLVTKSLAAIKTKT